MAKERILEQSTYSRLYRKAGMLHSERADLPKEKWSRAFVDFLMKEKGEKILDRYIGIAGLDQGDKKTDYD